MNIMSDTEKRVRELASQMDYCIRKYAPHSIILRSQDKSTSHEFRSWAAALQFLSEKK